MEFLIWDHLTCFRLQISLKANQSHLPKSDFPTPTDFIVIKLIPSLSSWGKQKYHPGKKSRQQTNTKKTDKRKTEHVIPCLMLSWKKLPGIILLRWHQQVKPTSLAFLSSKLNDVIWSHETDINTLMVVAKDNSKNLWH